MKKILITGASGFIGRHLISDLSAISSPMVIRILKRNKPVNYSSLHQIEITDGDLSDPGSLHRALEGVDTIINLAAELKDPANFLKTNIHGIENLVAAASAQGVKSMIHLSSVGVVGMQYSPEPVIVNEQTDCHPKNQYEESKLRSEQILLSSSYAVPGKLLILRPTNVFGDDHPREALLGFLQHISAGKRILHSKKSQLNYLYVKDLTGIMVQAVHQPFQHMIYNVGASISFSDFVSVCSGLLGTNPSSLELSSFSTKIARIFSAPLGASVRSKIKAISNAVIYDDSLLKNEYAYPYGIKEGLKRTINWYKEKNRL